MLRNIWAFIGEKVFNSIPGVPLSVDTNNNLKNGYEVDVISSVTSFNYGTGADATITGMTYTIPATVVGTATYIITFVGDITSNTAGAAIQSSVYANAVQVAASQQKVIPFSGGTLTSGSGRAMIMVLGKASGTAGQAITIGGSASSGTNTLANHSMKIERIS